MALTDQAVIDLTVRRLFPLDIPDRADGIYATLKANLNNVALLRLADIVADDPDLRRYLRQQYLVTLTNGQFALTGNDNNNNSLDQCLLETIYGEGERTTFVSGGPPGVQSVLQWLPNRNDLDFALPCKDYCYYHIGSDKTLTVVNYQGALVPGAPVIGLYSNFIPTVAQIASVKLLGRLVDVLAVTITRPDWDGEAPPAGQITPEMIAAVQGAPATA